LLQKLVSRQQTVSLLPTSTLVPGRTVARKGQFYLQSTIYIVQCAIDNLQPRSGYETSDSLGTVSGVFAELSTFY